jgi:hypothetical protein
MTQVEIAKGRLKVEVLGWDKLWAFKRRLDFPLEHVVGVRRWNEKTDSGWRGLRAPGTCLPGVIVAGTYHGRGEHVFYDVHDFENALVIELRDEWFARLIVEVTEPKAVLRFIPDTLSAAA